MKDNIRNTKDLYLLEALRLFADKGYDGTGVVEIAKAVGVTTSALYKHYANKQALFDAIIEEAGKMFKNNMLSLNINYNELSEKEMEKMIHMSVDDQIELMSKLFDVIAVGEYPRLFRKLMIVEQFKHPEFAKMYNERYLFPHFRSFESLMSLWMKHGVIKEGNAYAMANQYISPLILMIEAYDREPERKDEYIEIIKDHVIQFNAIYKEK